MLADPRQDIRQRAARKILEAREVEDKAPKKKVRKFSPTKMNSSAGDDTELALTGERKNHSSSNGWDAH